MKDNQNDSGRTRIILQKGITSETKVIPRNDISAAVHRDEIFHPKDEEMKALFTEGKVTPHMHVIAIPIIMIKEGL